MDFAVKQINITTNKTANLLDNNENPTNSFIGILLVLGGFVLLPLVKNTKKKKLILPTIFIIVTTLLLPLSATMLILLFGYRTAVHGILRLRHGSKFRELLKGPNMFWTLVDTRTNGSNTLSVINVLLVLRDKSGANCRKNVLHKLDKLMRDPAMWKLRCRIKRSMMGYAYLLKCRQNEEASQFLNCMRLSREFYVNRDVLQRTLSVLSVMKIDGGHLWDAYIGEEEIAWGNRKDCYPLIMRFHRSVGDELALLQLLQKCFSEEGICTEEDLKEIECGNYSDEDTVMQIMIKITIRLTHMTLVLSKFPKVMLEILFNKIPETDVCLKNLTGEKIIAWKVENGYKYVNKIKRIKQRFYGVGFLEVVISGISYSLSNVFKQKTQLSQSNDVHAVIQAIPHADRYFNMQKSKTFKLDNRLSFGVFQLPIVFPQNKKNKSQKSQYRRRCAVTTANLFELRKSYEFQFNYWFIQGFLELIPLPLIRWMVSPLFEESSHTVAISNVAGPKRISEKANDTSVEDIVFWMPYRGFAGVSVSILTYEGRFEMGIAIDKRYGVSAREAEKILESIFDYIDHLDAELEENI